MQSELTDTIMLVSYDPKENKAKVVSMPRDAYAVELPGFQIINGAYRDGGFDLINKIVEDATGVPVHFAMKMKIEGFIESVAGILGEVEIDVPEEIDTSKTGYDGYNDKFEKGKQKMNAERLTTYARERVISGEQGRVKKQQEIFQAIIDQSLKKMKGSVPDALGLIFKTITTMRGQIDNGNIVTDFDVNSVIFNRLQTVVKDMGMPSIMKNINLPFQDKGKEREFAYSMPKVDRLVLGQEQGLKWDPQMNEKRAHMLVVDNADMSSTLKYWGRIRDEVKRFIKS